MYKNESPTPPTNQGSNKSGKAILTVLDIDRFVKAVDPHTWNMILLTRSVVTHHNQAYYQFLT